jgi:AraC-like DNA-binding protein
MNLYLVNEALHARLGRARCVPISYSWQSNALRLIAEAGDVGITSVTLARELGMGRTQLQTWMSEQKQQGILSYRQEMRKKYWVRA